MSSAVQVFGYIGLVLMGLSLLFILGNMILAFVEGFTSSRKDKRS